MVPSAVGNESSGEVLRDMHELMDDGANFVILGELIEVTVKHFNDIMWRE